jgi:hypothetical protein
MQSLYPRLKFVDENSIDEQLDHIREEFVEVMKAEGLGDRDMELADLEQAIQTYFFMREKKDIDINAVRAAVVAKNKARGYEV